VSPRPARSVSPRGASVLPLPLPVLDDEALVRALGEGHPLAGVAAWRRFAPLVRRLLQRTLGPGHDIDDHVQETFARLFRAVTTLRDPSYLSSFVVGITMRVARTELRRRRLRRWLRLTETGELPDVPGNAADLDARQALGRVYAILDQVDDQSRVLFILRYVEGLELVEVGRALGCSLATVKRKLARASARVLRLARKEPALLDHLEIISGEATSTSEAEGDDHGR
jgi:RNA polymerase sigma-70 factor (ECF subfamily)